MLKCFLRRTWAVFSREILPNVFFGILVSGLAIGVVCGIDVAWKHLEQIFGQELLERILGYMALTCLLAIFVIPLYIGLRRCAGIWRECKQEG